MHILEQSRQSQCVMHSGVIYSKTTEADSNSLVNFFQISFFLYKLSLSEEEELTFLLFFPESVITYITFLPNTACSILPVFNVTFLCHHFSDYLLFCSIYWKSGQGAAAPILYFFAVKPVASFNTYVVPYMSEER